MRFSLTNVFVDELGVGRFVADLLGEGAGEDGLSLALGLVLELADATAFGLSLEVGSAVGFCDWSAAKTVTERKTSTPAIMPRSLPLLFFNWSCFVLASYCGVLTSPYWNKPEKIRLHLTWTFLSLKL
jgi:hypothetical protein